jgi:hypothetical protein
MCRSFSDQEEVTDAGPIRKARGSASPAVPATELERQRSVRDPEIAPTASKSVADQSRRKVTLTDVRTGTGLP